MTLKTVDENFWLFFPRKMLLPQLTNAVCLVAVECLTDPMCAVVGLLEALSPQRRSAQEKHTVLPTCAIIPGQDLLSCCSSETFSRLLVDQFHLREWVTRCDRVYPRISDWRWAGEIIRFLFSESMYSHYTLFAYTFYNLFFLLLFSVKTDTGIFIYSLLRVHSHIQRRFSFQMYVKIWTFYLWPIFMFQTCYEFLSLTVELKRVQYFKTFGVRTTVNFQIIIILYTEVAFHTIKNILFIFNLKKMRI